METWVPFVIFFFKMSCHSCLAGFLETGSQVRHSFRPDQLKAIKQHAFVTGGLIVELSKQHLRLLSGLSDTLIGGQLLSDTAVGEITKFSFDENQKASDYQKANEPQKLGIYQKPVEHQKPVVHQKPGEYQKPGEHKKPVVHQKPGEYQKTDEHQTQVVHQKPGEHQNQVQTPVDNNKHPGVASVSVIPLEDEGTGNKISTVLRPLGVKVSQISSFAALAPLKSEEYYDMEWSKEPKPSPTTHHHLADFSSSSEEHILDGDEYLTLRKTTPAPWVVNPLLGDSFHKIHKVPAEVSPTNNPSLDPDMFPVLVTDGNILPTPRPKQPEKVESFNPLAAFGNAQSVGHWI